MLKKKIKEKREKERDGMCVCVGGGIYKREILCEAKNHFWAMDEISSGVTKPVVSHIHPACASFSAYHFSHQDDHLPQCL